VFLRKFDFVAVFYEGIITFVVLGDKDLAIRVTKDAFLVRRHMFSTLQMLA
jgi:hypothetical protein